MTEPITYQIELNGNVGSRSLRPLIDNFSVDQSEDGVTRLVGNITDASQLHGVVVHLASMSVEIISIGPVQHRDAASNPDNDNPNRCKNNGRGLPERID